MHFLTQPILTLFLTLLSFSSSLPALPTNLFAPAFSPPLLPTSENTNLTLPFPLNNTSSTSPSNTTPNLLLPHIYRIPNTSPTLWLRVNFGDPRTPLSEFDLGGLLALANATLQEDIAHYGANRLFDVFFQQDTRQWFREILHDAAHPLCVSIKSERTGRRLFTNEQLVDVIRGLDVYLRQGGKCYRATFVVFQGMMATTMVGAGFVARLTPTGVELS